MQAFIVPWKYFWSAYQILGKYKKKKSQIQSNSQCFICIASLLPITTIFY